MNSGEKREGGVGEHSACPVREHGRSTAHRPTREPPDVRLNSFITKKTKRPQGDWQDAGGRGKGKSQMGSLSHRGSPRSRKGPSPTLGSPVPGRGAPLAVSHRGDLDRLGGAEDCGKPRSTQAQTQSRVGTHPGLQQGDSDFGGSRGGRGVGGAD